MTAPAILERFNANERSIYVRAASRSRATYMRKHGGAAVPVPAGARVSIGGRFDWVSDAARDAVLGQVRAAAAEWRAVHLEPRELAAHRAGCAAVRKRLTQWGQLERLEDLGLSGRRTPARPVPASEPAAAPVVETVETVETPAAAPRKRTRWVTCDRHRDKLRGMPARRRAEWWLEGGPGSPCAGEHIAGCRLFPGTDYFAPAICHGEHREPWQDAAPADLEPVPDTEAAARPVLTVVPDTVPAPMPRQSRDARRASNRELAARMRAAGLEPRGEMWERAKRGELEGFEPMAGGVR